MSAAFEEAHQLGMFTVLWCYLRNDAFKKDGVDYHTAADLTGQANHLGVTMQADIIKQKLPENNGGFGAVKFGKTIPLVYSELTTDNPIDLTRWQVVNCYMGRIGLINSGGESKGASDLAEAVRTAVINKRAGGQGLISGARRSSGRWPRGSTCSTPSRTSTSTVTSRWPDQAIRPVSSVHPAVGHAQRNSFSVSEGGGAMTDTAAPPARPAELTRSRRHPVRRRLRRRHAAHRRSVHLGERCLRQRPRTLPDFPAEIRAPAGTVTGVSSFQVHISDHDITTPGDEPDVLVAMNPAALRPTWTG